MQDRYRHEMERLGPRQEELDRLQAMLEGGTGMKQAKRLSGRMAAAILVCAALMATAAAAAVPAVWEALRSHLGVFAPYVQTIQGTACRDKGIELQVLGALSDDLEARVYLSVRDVDEDRLNEYLTLEGRLSVETETAPEPESGVPQVYIGDSAAKQFQLLSYDPEAKTALYSASILYGDLPRKRLPPNPGAQLSVTGMSTRSAMVSGTASCSAVTGAEMESLPAGPEDAVIFSPSDVANLGYTDEVLPARRVALAPEQNPMPIEGTEDMWVSSMGFASDGLFHIRLAFSDGVGVCDDSGGSWFLPSLSPYESWDDRVQVFQEVLVPGGMDILFPLITVQDLELIKGGAAEFYGSYMRPGTDIAGSWTVDFQMEYHPSATLDWTGELSGCQVRQITLSPLSVTMHSIGQGGFHRATLYAVKKDGSTVAAEPGTGRYSNAGLGSGETVWAAFNTWKFEEPVNLKDVVRLDLAGESIPTDQTKP